MEKANVKLRKWGNSFGVILPAEIIRSQNLKEDVELEILISPKNKTTGEEIFGKLKFKKPIQVLLDETDKDFEPRK